ncbi:MAG: AAA family ATPase, partial [Planctomycetes bacterium]|nr:AAA family ATPase [Planctomycetota bacterium]
MLSSWFEAIAQTELFYPIDIHLARLLIAIEKPEGRSEAEALALLILMCSHYTQRGHSALPLDLIQGKSILEILRLGGSDQWLSQVNRQLNLWSMQDRDWKKLASSAKQIISVNNQLNPLVYDEETQMLYLQRYWVYEHSLSQVIAKSRKLNYALDNNTLKSLNELFPESEEDGKTNWQKLAAYASLQNHFTVISGGPGTGKTTTVTKILVLLLQQNPKARIHLIAPTGKAADRLSASIAASLDMLTQQSLLQEKVKELIPREAFTLHRFLRYHPTMGFRHNKSNPRMSDIIILDEASMVPLEHFNRLFEALPSSCRIILLGDKDQLAAVENGNVLGDLIAGGEGNSFSQEFCQCYESLFQVKLNFDGEHSLPLADSTVNLEHSYRFHEQSGIGHMARLLNQNHQNALVKSDFMNLEERFPQELSLWSALDSTGLEAKLGPKLKSYFAAYLQALKNYRVEEGLEGELLGKAMQFRVLCAQHEGLCGVEALNEIICRSLF